MAHECAATLPRGLDRCSSYPSGLNRCSSCPCGLDRTFGSEHDQPGCLFSTCTGRDECCAWPAGSAAAPSGSQGTREGGAHTRNVHCVAQRRWRSGHCGHIDWDAGNLRPQLANRKAHHRSQFALNQPPVMPTNPQRLDGRAPHSRNALTPSPKTKALRQIHHRGRNLCHRR